MQYETGMRTALIPGIAKYYCKIYCILTLGEKQVRQPEKQVLLTGRVTTDVVGYDECSTYHAHTPVTFTWFPRKYARLPSIIAC